MARKTKLNFKAAVAPLLGGTAGYVTADLVENYLPTESPYIAPAAKVAGGVILSTQKNEYVKFAGVGMLVNAGLDIYNLVQTQMGGATAGNFPGQLETKTGL